VVKPAVKPPPTEPASADKAVYVGNVHGSHASIAAPIIPTPHSCPPTSSVLLKNIERAMECAASNQAARANLLSASVAPHPTAFERT